MSRYQSWGRYPKAPVQRVLTPSTRAEISRLLTGEDSVLAFGLGRSQGDSCLNSEGTLIDTRLLNHFLGFNQETGILRCEAGVTLADILDEFVPRGYFLPVTPGTKFVTVGGAIANDVHGKSHHRSGTFGCYVERFELIRSKGEKVVCSEYENVDLFRATIGGLGLTGLITWADIKLKQIDGPCIRVETVPFESIHDFFDVLQRFQGSYEYSVAWFDSTTQGRHLGRGVLLLGNHSSKACNYRYSSVTVPFDGPGWLLNQWSVQMFNSAYFHVQKYRAGGRLIHYEPFFYPLDWVHDWNRLYGKRGFVQYQCVIPPEHAKRGILELMNIVSSTREASFLTTLKQFGSVRSPGMMSFPRPGTAVAFDFPLRGGRTFALLDQLDQVVLETGGALYPAKDSRMSPEMFRASFPEWQRFSTYIDPVFSSSFWRRVAL